MKQEINPVVAVVVVVAIIGVVAFFLIKKTGGSPDGTSQSMPMPKQASDFMRGYMEQRRPGAAPGGAAPAGAPAAGAPAAGR